MDYEKKYEKLVDAVKVLRDNNPSDEGIKNWVNDNVPELKESEDTIRKKLLSAFKDIMAYADEDELWYGLPYNDIIAWLEKQSYKPLNDTDEDIVEAVKNISTLDLVGPKFHIGDYIVNDYCKGKVIELTDDAYLLDTEQGIPFSCEHNAHLWTIQDANVGDVLVTVDNNHPFIYKGCLDHNHPYSPVAYCGINTLGYFCIGGDSFDHWWTNEKVQPSTKEQRDILFQKMKESGYEWDAEKKELMKIEHKPLDKVEPKFHKGDWAVSNLDKKARQISEVHFDDYNSYYVVDGKDVNLEEYDRLHHLWTIDDANDGDVLSDGTTIFIFKDLLSDGSVMSYCDYDTNSGESDAFCPFSMNLMYLNFTPATKEQRDLLFQKIKEAGYEWNAENKELKKIGQESAKWSENDEVRLKSAITLIKRTSLKGNEDIIEATIDWLNSLKDRVQPQNAWKPSEEQMKLLREVQQALLGKDCHNRFVNFMCELKRLKEK